MSMFTEGGSAHDWCCKFCTLNISFTYFPRFNHLKMTDSRPWLRVDPTSVILWKYVNEMFKIQNIKIFYILPLTQWVMFCAVNNTKDYYVLMFLGIIYALIKGENRIMFCAVLMLCAACSTKHHLLKTVEDNRRF